jgi:hypothetical protein
MANAILKTFPLLAAALLAACDLAPLGRDSGAIEARSRTPAGLADSLRAAQAKWERAAAKSYSFRIHRECLCFPYGWAQVRVEDGRVAALDSVPGQTVEFAPGQEAVSPTIDDLFATLSRRIGDPEFTVEAAFDPELGYPTRIRIAYAGTREVRDADVSTETGDLAIRDRSRAR